MISKKGGAKAENTILFGKYRIYRTLGHGRTGTVYLARHLILNEYRAVKQVRREDGDDQSLLREALILKELKHPGIPIIYDLERDESYYYLIEEYLDGESLFALINRQGNLSSAKTLSFGIELCQIMIYLHSFKQNPILYLDLQPKNLLICDGFLKLIDFDQAVFAALSGKLRKRYGTAGFAAPEQYTNEPMDIRTDIYAIGALLHFMKTGTAPRVSEAALRNLPEEPLFDVIKGCLRQSKDERYACVEYVLGDLLKLKPGVFSKNQISLLKIAVVCSSPGMGATHTSFGLSSYLSDQGIKNLYEEHCTSGNIRNSAACMGAEPDKTGIFRVGDLEIKPRYGECVKLETPPYDAVIEDYGAELEAIRDKGGYGLIVLLCGEKWWEVRDSVKAVRLLSQEKNLRVIVNHTVPDQRIEFFGEGQDIQIYRMPYCPDPEYPDAAYYTFWTEILRGTDAERFLPNDRAYGRKPKRRIWVRKKLGEFLGNILKKKR